MTNTKTSGGGENHRSSLRMIWVVSHDDLIPWLEAQRNQPVDAVRARWLLV
jgi:hypothetical protein